MVFGLSLWCILLLTAPSTTGLKVGNVPVHKVFLRQNEPSSYCLAVSSAIDVMEHRPRANFLATQVWPSARTAASAIQKHADPKWVICEFGCGPGLPSLTAAKMVGSDKVYATDLDEFALELVKSAAEAQGLQDRVDTRLFDLVSDDIESIPKANLYILSDVFESAYVASGAARVTQGALEMGKVWVFAQSDRAQREVYLKEMQEFLKDSSIAWTPLQDSPPKNRDLWLCDIDETSVEYG